MDLSGLAGVLAAILGLALTVNGVFFNGRAIRALVTRTHQDSQTLLEAIRQDIQTVQQNGQRRHDDLVAFAQRQHDDLLAYMKDVDRRHTDLLTELAKRS